MGYRYEVPHTLVGCVVVALLGASTTAGIDSTHGEYDQVFDKPMGSNKQNPCELLSDHVTINCSNRGLSSIPKDITFKCRVGECIKIDLSGNCIRSIGDSAFHDLPYVEFIDLSKNNLTKISRRAFNNLVNLKTLRLNNNSLRYDEFPSTAFKPLSSLETLFIENQVLQKTNTKYPSQILSSLSKLKNLSMDFVYNENVAYRLQQVTKLDVKFEAAKALATITMFVPGKDPLLQVPGDTFQHISNITVLSVRSCRINEMKETALSYFTQLQSLDLGLNKNLSLHASIDLLRHLNSPLTHLDLEYVDRLRFTKPVKLTKEMMSVFEHLPIQNLSLVQDHITSIDAKYINQYWNNLRTIYIGRNPLVGSGETNLYKLAVNLAKMSNLTLVDVSNWWINSEEESRSSNTETIEYFGSSRVREPRMEFFNHLIKQKFNMAKIKFPPNLETVILRGTFRPGVYVDYLDCYPNRLKYLDVSRNGFTYWPVKGDPYPCFNSLHVLNMGYNDFSSIAADRYKIAPSLKKLILSGNKLYIMLRDQKKKHFKHLNNLTHIDLSHNSIVNELYPEVFSELSNVKEIILRRNRLLAVTSFNQRSVEFIDFSLNFIDKPYMNITEMPSLKNVSLVANNIRVVPETSLRAWRGKNISFDFSRNPFNCSSCQFLPFLRWFNNVSSDPRTVTLLHAENYRCGDEQKIFVREVRLDELVNKCTSFAWIVISIALSICVALCITLGSILYRHRWTIRYYIVSAARRTRGHPPQMLRRFQYDAFVVYSSEDRHWVHDAMRTRLEDGSDFGLCIHYRNFLPGRHIEESVIDAIENSRHSILVVSRNFLRSEWCIFEMHMARNIFRQQRKDVLIVVLLEDIPVQEAPLTLVNLLRTRTYLKWPADDNVGQEAFWEMLKETLKKEPEVVD